MKWLGKICHWLHRLVMGNPQFPAGSPQAERVELQRVLRSVQAVNACLPQTDPNSGTATATAGLLNGCSTIASAFSVFVLQTQVAICWLWSQIQAILTSLTTVDATLLDLQDQITALQASIPAPIPGVVSVLPGGALGTGGTTTLSAGSTTSEGVIHCTAGTGSSSAGGLMAELVNSLGWPTEISFVGNEGNTSNAPFVIEYGYVGSGNIFITADTVFGSFNDGDTLDISYRVADVA